MQQQIRVTPAMLSNGELMVCGSCGAEVFRKDGMISIVRISGIIPENQTGKDVYAEIPAGNVCVNCGALTRDVVPVLKRDFVEN